MTYNVLMLNPNQSLRRGYPVKWPCSTHCMYIVCLYLMCA